MRGVLRWTAWLLALTGLWLLYVGAFTRTDLVAGVLAAAIAATVAEALRAQGLLRFALEPAWGVRAWKVPFQVVREFGVVTLVLSRALLRRGEIRGAYRAVPFPAGGDDARSAGRRAFATWAGTLSPNTIVVDIDPEREVALVHDLDPRRVARDVL